MRILAIVAALILTIICRPLAGSTPPRVPDGSDQTPSEDDWRRAFMAPESARVIAHLRGESIEHVYYRMAIINMRRRIRRAASVPAVPHVRRASFSIDDPAGTRTVPDRPVYASPQSATGGVISPDRPTTVTVPLGHGHVAMTNPAPVYYNYPQPAYAPTFPVYAAPTMPYYAIGRRGLFGGRLFRGGGSCVVDADGSVSCGR